MEEYHRRVSGETPTPNILEAATRLGEAGYAVFPTNGKEPIVDGSFYASSRDAGAIEELFAKKPRASIAIACGAGYSDIVVVDADSEEAYEYMVATYGPPHVKTRRGGHWYFRHPKDGKIKSVSKYDELGLLDCKGDLGIVIAPPSPGKEWTDGIPEKAELRVLPDELRPPVKSAPKGGAGGPAALDDEKLEAASQAVAEHYAKPGEQYDFGFALAGFLIGNGVGEDDAYTIMYAALERTHGVDEDAEHNIGRVCTTAAERVANDETVQGGPHVEEHASRPGLVDKLLGILWGRRRKYARTDTGNGERFADQHGRNVRWISRWGKHFVWNGRVWARDEREEISSKAQKTAKSIHADAARPGVDPDTQRKITQHALASQSGSRIKAMIDLAKPHVAASHEDFDRDLWLLNCQNGTIDLRTGELREHRRDDLITKVSQVEHDAQAEAPEFDAFLKSILPNDSVRAFLQRAFGAALVGEIKDEVLIILYGSGSNGKTTLVEAVTEACGEYAIASAPDLLMSKGDSHPTELADLFGARLAVCMESDEGRRLNEGRVKQLTGRDKIKARRMREDFWEFDPTHTVFLGTNHRPEIRGTDHAIWRRLKLVPFEVTIPDAEQDKDLPAKLRSELAGILRWLIEGCLEWQKVGLAEPDEVKVATSSYRADMDVLEQFIEDRCVLEEAAEVQATVLYQAYVRWCERVGEAPKKQRVFGASLGERGFESFKFTSGVYKDRAGWRRIGLRAEEHDPDDDPDDTPNGRKRSYDGGDPPLNATRAEDPPLGESGLGKGKTQDSSTESGGSGPNSGLNGPYEPRVEVYTEKSSASSASSAAHPLSDDLAPGESATLEELRRRRWGDRGRLLYLTPAGDWSEDRSKAALLGSCVTFSGGRRINYMGRDV